MTSDLNSSMTSQGVRQSGLGVRVAVMAAVAVGGSDADSTTTDIGGGVMMPRVNLGTCCGSDPKIGVPDWFTVGGVGVDSAWDCQ
jgi:hypothetical protein